MKNTIITLLLVVVTGLGVVVFVQSDSDSTPTTQKDTTTQQQDTDDTDTPIINNSEDVESLADSGLEKVPASLFNDTSITQLDVSGNRLTGALPSEIQKLSKLEVLDASDNNLTGIPAELGQLSRLRIINFANNDISGLPMELSNLSNLETLDLRGNPNISTFDLSKIQPDIPNAQILTD